MIGKIFQVLSNTTLLAAWVEEIIKSEKCLFLLSYPHTYLLYTVTFIPISLFFIGEIFWHVKQIHFKERWFFNGKKSSVK